MGIFSSQVTLVHGIMAKTNQHTTLEYLIVKFLPELTFYLLKNYYDEEIKDFRMPSSCKYSEKPTNSYN